ncbi:hypothetical protein [Sulfurospirillum barnesii]|uniref:Uncharacterized protein n=1 Tax=Sulfurospirillum barnesii (strain ATCC 700032 / DSM 10660 / SES-3) TaxID=760154 RepID=I3XWF8_SULBS|nr:hypothetical protein [Sulfurospirillum barnesii]AFL68282.1 hypothetical protein Sulba_0983 [Sulfurospirillum barnesii SES-3]
MDETRKQHTRRKTSPTSTPKTIQKRVSKPKKKELLPAQKRPSFFLKTIAALVVLLFLGFGVKFALEQTLYANPLIGRWRAQTTLGIIEIEFERDAFSSFGTKHRVSYDVSEQFVLVMDESIKVGSLYKIIDKNTISSEAGGFKTLYKRVK